MLFVAQLSETRNRFPDHISSRTYVTVKYPLYIVVLQLLILKRYVSNERKIFGAEMYVFASEFNEKRIFNILRVEDSR